MKVEHNVPHKVLNMSSPVEGLPTHLLNSIPAMVAYIDKDLCYQYMNAAYEKFFGKTRNSTLGRPVKEVLGNAVYHQLKNHIVEVLKGKTVHFEDEMYIGDLKRWREVTFIPDFDTYGHVKGYTVCANDITGRKRREKKLEEKNRALQDYFDNAVVGLHWVDRNGIILWANKAELNLLGYTKEEYIGHHIADFHADRTAIDDILCRLSKNETLNQYEAVLRCKDGSTRDVVISTNVLWENNKFSHTQCFTVDVTEQKKLFTALQESEHRYRELIEKLPVAICTCDAEGQIEIYNSTAVALWGRKPEVGKDKWCGSWRIYKTDGTPLPLDNCPMAIALKEGRSVDNEEIVIQRPDGTRINARPYPHPILDASGAVIGAVNMLVDITQSKTEIEINARLAAIVQSSDDAIISKTLNGIVTSWNDAAQRIFGYSANEMIGQSITKLIPPDRLEEEPKILERLKKGERVDHFETKRITKDGEILDISLTISPVKDNEGKIVGASKIARDITEQKKLIEALRESEERFRTVADTAPVMIWMSGTNKLCTFFNKRWLGFTGRSLEQELGNGWMECIHPDDLKSCLETYKSSFVKRVEFEHEYRLKRHDGEYRWIQNHGIPRYSPNGTFMGYISSGTDIHERKAASEELEKQVVERTAALRQANINLEKSNEELKRFAYVASHDLQEPLRKIQAFGNLILERNGNEFSEKGKTYLDRMINASNKMQNLIDALLEFSRAAHSQENFKETDLNLLIDEIKKEFQESITEKNASIYVEPLPKLRVIPFQFKQMLSNIIGNALKYAKRKEDPVIKITSSIVNAKDISKEGIPGGADYCRLTIQDNGIGFEQEHAQIIFELFQRLHAKHEYSGSGIGLAICKKIAENHKGLITAESEPGKGAAFHIFIPVKQQ